MEPEDTPTPEKAITITQAMRIDNDFFTATSTAIQAQMAVQQQMASLNLPQLIASSGPYTSTSTSTYPTYTATYRLEPPELGKVYVINGKKYVLAELEEEMDLTYTPDPFFVQEKPKRSLRLGY